jgi:quercetin dioxygenase-like cupin family protein
LEINDMRLTTFSAVLLAIGATAVCAQQPTSPSGDATASVAANVAAPPGEKGDDGFKWGPAPAIFPPGAQMAVLQGDPGSTNLFTVRLRFPNGYRIAPHTHPTDEHVTVISGTFLVGMGTTMADRKSMLTLRQGGFVTAPANHAHYAVAQGPTVVQVHAMGPFAMTYSNPADTPKAATPR